MDNIYNRVRTRAGGGRDSAGDTPTDARPASVDPNALLEPAEAAAQLGLSVRRLERLRFEGGGPLYVKIGRRTVRYKRGALQAWIDERERRSTSDTGNRT